MVQSTGGLLARSELRLYRCQGLLQSMDAAQPKITEQIYFPFRENYYSMLFYYNSSASGGTAGDIAREKNIRIDHNRQNTVIILKKYVMKCDFQWEIFLLISNLRLIHLQSLTGPGTLSTSSLLKVYIPHIGMDNILEVKSSLPKSMPLPFI